MGNHSYISGGSDSVAYSSPVPIIGLYIFGASLAGLVVMIHDVVVGIRARKHWLPCTYFKLNSVTLTLLAVATKLPVDLTTPMPCPVDQLSKLTGTAFICISMGFLAPSLGALAESSCFTNMVALSIFVITVAVNIIIQLCTGVIFVFFVEHIILLILMLLLLMMLWYLSLKVKDEKRLVRVGYRDIVLKGKHDCMFVRKETNKSLFDRLKYCYAYAYCSNPQLKLSMDSMNATISTLCLWCCIIIIETTIRSLILKQVEFHEGVSDYSWSMACIVYTQIATVIVGTIVIVFRCVSLFTQIKLDDSLGYFSTIVDIRITWDGLWKTFVSMIKYILVKIVLIVEFVTVYPLQLMRDDLLGIKKEVAFSELFFLTSRYTEQKIFDDMIRWKNQVLCNFTHYEPGLYLSGGFPSQRINGTVINRGRVSIEVNSFSVAFLVKIAETTIPKRLISSLLLAFNQAKDVIHFVDDTLELQIRHFESENFIEFKDDLTMLFSSCTQPGDNYDAAVNTIRKVKELMHSDYDDLRIVMDLILYREHPSEFESLYNNINELFGDMLHVLYAQLPIAICKYLRKIPAEEFEDGVRLAMEFLFKIGILKCQENWIYPAGITCIASDEETSATGRPFENASDEETSATGRPFEEFRLQRRFHETS